MSADENTSQLNFTTVIRRRSASRIRRMVDEPCRTDVDPLTVRRDESAWLRCSATD